jgi:choice-of-anchor B domain-containing protein
MAFLFLPLFLLSSGHASAQDSVTGLRVACTSGFAGAYPCSQVDLLSHLANDELGPGAGESLDLWGWTDPDSGAEYVLAGMADRTVFVDISVAESPRVVGFLPHSGGQASFWRDVKVYANHAYIVADGAGFHGLQVFDLTQLRGQSGDPVEFTMTAHYQGFGSAHNVAVNEETGFLFVTGASGGDSCSGGLHMINVQIPATPRFVGCFAHAGTGRAGTGYTHDVQCITYHGPDQEHDGQEICFGANETAVSIADVTVKDDPRALAKAEYPGVAYAHQGWLTEDRRFFILGDELDERGGEPARSLIFDVSDLDDPVFVTEYLAPVRSIDHNLYIKGDFAYLANYTAGLHILNVSDPTRATEVGFFDTTPNEGGASFGGTWSSYPFFESGAIALSSIQEGLFILQSTNPALAVGTVAEPELPSRFAVEAPYPNPFEASTQVEVDLELGGTVRVALIDLLGREMTVVFEGEASAGRHRYRVEGGGLAAGTYLVEVRVDGIRNVRTVTRQ